MHHCQMPCCRMLHYRARTPCWIWRNHRSCWIWRLRFRFHTRIPCSTWSGSPCLTWNDCPCSIWRLRFPMRRCRILIPCWTWTSPLAGLAAGSTSRRSASVSRSLAGLGAAVVPLAGLVRLGPLAGLAPVALARLGGVVPVPAARPVGLGSAWAMEGKVRGERAIRTFGSIDNGGTTNNEKNQSTMDNGKQQ